MSDETRGVPTPGRDAAPDVPSDPESEVTVDEETDTVTRAAESSVGTGAGHNPVVRVTAPVERQHDEPTRHPTLREGDLAGEPAGTPEKPETKENRQPER